MEKNIEYLKVAKILSTVGLKGEVRVYTTSTFKNIRYKKNNVLFYLDESNNYKELHIKSYRNKEGNIDYLSFNEITTIEDAQNLLNKELFALKDYSNLKKDEFYYSDLISSKVFDEDNNELGIINDIKEFNANISLELKLNNNYKTIFIPFNDFFIKEIDIDNKKIIIHVIEGLLEIWKLKF